MIRIFVIQHLNKHGSWNSYNLIQWHTHEQEDDVVDRDSNDPDGDIAHPQKHAKSPELAREFLLDAAAVIFKEQVVMPLDT